MSNSSVFLQILGASTDAVEFTAAMSPDAAPLQMGQEAPPVLLFWLSQLVDREAAALGLGMTDDALASDTAFSGRLILMDLIWSCGAGGPSTSLLLGAAGAAAGRRAALPAGLRWPALEDRLRSGGVKGPPLRSGPRFARLRP